MCITDSISDIYIVRMLRNRLEADSNRQPYAVGQHTLYTN